MILTSLFKCLVWLALQLLLLCTGSLRGTLTHIEWRDLKGHTSASISPISYSHKVLLKTFILFLQLIKLKELKGCFTKSSLSFISSLNCVCISPWNLLNKQYSVNMYFLNGSLQVNTPFCLKTKPKTKQSQMKRDIEWLVISEF